MRFASLVRTNTLPFALVGAILLASPVALMAQDSPTSPTKQKRTLTLSATGSIDSKPDMASISTGIETVAVKARDALDDNNEVMARMMKSLKNAGLEERDISTINFSIRPRYEQLRSRSKIERPQTPRIIGYTVHNSLHITVRKLDDLGRIMDRLVSLGSNRIGSISFGLSDLDKALDEARKDAMRKILDKAELYARAAGVRLGAITSISENGGRYTPRPMAYRSKKVMSMPVPIAPGELKTTIGVNVTWALVD